MKTGCLEPGISIVNGVRNIPEKHIAATTWELQRFVIHTDSLDRKFKLPEGWEPVHYQEADGNRWYVIARRRVES